jgi:flagellar hook-associated protein 1
VAGLIDIGKSAINAQRQALNVTGQNIANVNTEGYHRRDADMLEVSGAQSALASKTGQLGLGVQISSVRRAFDAYLVHSANSAESKFQTASNFVASLERLEDFLLPTDGDLSSQMSEFFAKLSDISANPGDLAPRAAAIEQANGLANSFNITAQVVGDLKSQLRGLVDADVESVNRLMESIGQVNGRLRSSNIGAAPPLALLDERDRLVSEISGLIRVSVNYGRRSEVDLRLGRYSEGPQLVKGEDVTPLSTIHSDISGSIFQLGSGMVFKSLDDGSLKGLAESLDIIQSTEKSLDLLATRFVNEVNTVHTSGIDFDGEHGKELFTAKKFEITQPKQNSSELDIKLMEVPGKIDSLSDIKFTYDGRINFWSGTDSSGQIIGKGRTEIKIDGLVVQINSKANHGDVFNISKMSGDAGRMSFLLKDGSEFAAGANFVITPSSSNSGSANLTSHPVIPSKPNINSLVDITANSLSPVSYTEFLSGGAVGYIPANVEKLKLSSFDQNATATMNFSSSDNLSSFQIKFGGTTHTFSSVDPEPSLNRYFSPKDIAKNLNDGVLKTTGSPAKTLKDLGLFVSGFEGGLKFSGATAFEASTFTLKSGSTSKAVLTDSAAASGFKVFTREGRQIAGIPLSGTDATNLLTVENGFNRNASYRADYLNEIGGAGYRGAEIKNLLSDGYFKVDTTASVLTGQNLSQLIQQNPALNQFSAQTLNFTSSDNLVNKDIVVQGSLSVKAIAEKINSSLTKEGISVTAKTIASLELDASAPAIGNVSFSINTHDGEKISIAKSYTNSDLTTLVKPINDQYERTGITAEISGDGKKIVLIDNAGQDISLDQFSGSLLNVNALDQSFNKLLTTDVGLTQATKIMGTLDIKSPREFTLKSSLGQSVTAQADSMISGGVERSLSDSGTVADFSWQVTADQLAPQASPDGLRIASPNAVFSLVSPLNGQKSPALSVSLNSRDLTELNSDGISKQLIQKARDLAALPSLQGSIITSLPAENSTMAFRVGATEYTLKYKDGSFSVAGTQSDRILVSSEKVVGGHQLAITAPSGVMSGRSIEVLNNTDAKAFGLATTDATSDTILRGRTFELTEGGVSANSTVVTAGLTNSKEYMITSLGSTTFSSANSSNNVAQTVGTIFTSDGGALTGTGTITQILTGNGGANGTGGDADFTTAMNVHALTDLKLSDATSEWIIADNTSNTTLTVGDKHILTHDGSYFLLNGATLAAGIKLVPAGQRFEVVGTATTAHALNSKFTMNINSSGAVVDESGTAIGTSLELIRSGISKSFDVKLGTSNAMVTVNNDRGIYTFSSSDSDLKFISPFSSTVIEGSSLTSSKSGTKYKVVDAGTSTTYSMNDIFTSDGTAVGNGVKLLPLTGDKVASLTLDSSAYSPIVSLVSSQSNGALSITPSLNASSLGLNVAGFDFEMDSNGFKSISADSKPTEVAVGVSGLSGQRLSIDKLPPEDLIVVIDKEGSRRLGLQYENSDYMNNDPPEENYQIKMTDSKIGKIELFDTKTGDSIATRFSNGATDFELNKYSIELSGFADQGDVFDISLNRSNPGDSRNMDALIALSIKSDGRLSFQDDFRAIALGVGSQLVSGRMIEQSAEAMRDAAVIAEDELSGVNLDEEAGRLLEQQQAYKAAAEILKAARQMFDTLLNIM